MYNSGEGSGTEIKQILTSKLYEKKEKLEKINKASAFCMISGV